MYDKQVIVQSHADDTIKLGSGNLQLKAGAKGIPHKLVEFPQAGQKGVHAAKYELHTALAWLTKNSRLYIRGHGNWTAQTVGKVDARTWATTLVDAGLKDVKMISICACQAGRDKGSADVGRIKQSADSFASQFHKLLKELGGHEYVVYARVYNVITRSGSGGFGVGQKTTGQIKVSIPSIHSRAKSKLRFSWDNGTQKREWVDYAHGGTESVEDDLDVAGVSTVSI